MPTEPHVWYTPADLATLLDGRQHGKSWRSRCPAHSGDNPQALSLSEGIDKYGHPMTLVKCFAHECDIRDICAALGIALRNLFCIHPDYAQANHYAPRATSSRIDRLKTMQEPSPDEMAQILLEEMIVSDPEWIQSCQPARAKLWELGQSSLKRMTFFQALTDAGIPARAFWSTLAAEEGAREDG